MTAYIYSLNDLYFNYLAVPASDLEEELRCKEKYYETFSISKRSGGERTLCAIKQDSTVYKAQKNFYEYYLKKFSLPVCVKGFVQGSSYREYLAAHCGQDLFLRIDIKDFFPSVKSELISETFARFIRVDNDAEKAQILHLIVDLVTLNGSLPQGAVTSPAVSNLVFARLDQRILKYCQALDIRYTRYADDLLFSQNRPQNSNALPALGRPWFLKKIRYILRSNGFSLNDKKLRYAHGELALNGFVIGNTLRLSRRRFQDIAHIISCAEKFLPASKASPEQFLIDLNRLSLLDRDLSLYPFASVSAFVQYLCGYRAYLLGWLNGTDSGTNKRIRKTVRRIDRLITNLEPPVS